MLQTFQTPPLSGDLDRVGGKAQTRREVAMVPRLWPESTIVCIGGGPSLTADDVKYCRDKAKIIAINDGYRMAPFADVLYAADSRWWNEHKGVPSFTGLKFAVAHQPGGKRDRFERWPEIAVLENTGNHGLETSPTGLRTGDNSGYQAINLAVHLGAKRILLLGYDMQTIKGKKHWFGDHPVGLNAESPYNTFIVKFKNLVQPLREVGVKVINCSRSTALTAFPIRPLREVLQ